MGNVAQKLFPDISGVGHQVDLAGTPYSLSEDFVSSYRMHPLLPDTFQIDGDTVRVVVMTWSPWSAVPSVPLHVMWTERQRLAVCTDGLLLSDLHDGERVSTISETTHDLGTGDTAHWHECSRIMPVSMPECSISWPEEFRRAAIKPAWVSCAAARIGHAQQQSA